MIEKCPHCGRDVLFSGDICPACGYTAVREERKELTGIEQDRRSGRFPSYSLPLETELTAGQKRGRILLWLVSGIILAPWITYNAVRCYWISPDLFGIFFLICAGGLVNAVWKGKSGSRKLVAFFSAVGGVAALSRCIFRPEYLNPVETLAFSVFGLLYLFAAHCFSSSKNIINFLEIRRRGIADR